MAPLEQAPAGRRRFLNPNTEPPFAQTPRHRCPAPRGGERLKQPAKGSGGAGGGGHGAVSSRLPPQGSGSQGRCRTRPLSIARAVTPGREVRLPAEGPGTAPALPGQPPRAPSAAAEGWRGDAVTFALAQDAAAEALQQNVGGFLVRSRHRRAGCRAGARRGGGGKEGPGRAAAAQGSGGTSRSRLGRHFHGTRRKPQPRPHAHNAPRGGSGAGPPGRTASRGSERLRASPSAGCHLPSQRRFAAAPVC